MTRTLKIAAIAITTFACLLLAASTVTAQEFTEDFDRDACTFTTTGNNPYFLLQPGHQIVIEGDEDDEGEIITIRHRITVLSETQVIDGVRTRVVEEFETEDAELVEISRNFIAHCRETGAVWYFGEDVEDYEDGELVGSAGEWRAGVNGAKAGILMPGTPTLGARFFQEVAPADEALDRAEIVGLGGELTVPAGTFDNVLKTEESSALDPESLAEKFYAYGVGIIKDETLELISYTPPPCVPNDTTHCLNNGRFEVTTQWGDFNSNQGDGHAILGSADSGEFWFFDSDNTELIVKVLDACNLDGFNNFWVFSSAATNVDVTLTVRDTTSGQTKTYSNDLGNPFEPILDTDAFDTCP